MAGFLIRKAPVAMLAGMFVAGMAYGYLDIARVPFDLRDPEMPTYAEAHPVRWRVLWVTINLAGFVSAMGFVLIVLGRLWQSADRT
ncbi:hypothetical protein [Yoonia sp.]|uniref:hypothetical protein n=1 Tax=Yoonia sp. TaxID=2212373 RepID=UPI002FD967AC